MYRTYPGLLVQTFAIPQGLLRLLRWISERGNLYKKCFDSYADLCNPLAYQAAMANRDTSRFMPDHSRRNDIFSASPLNNHRVHITRTRKIVQSSMHARVKLAQDQLPSSFHQNVPSLPLRYKDKHLNPNSVPLFSKNGFILSPFKTSPLSLLLLPQATTPPSPHIRGTACPLPQTFPPDIPRASR